MEINFSIPKHRIIIRETLFVFWNVQLEISLRIGNLQILLGIGLLKRKKERKKKRNEKNRKEIKIVLSLGYPNSYFYNKRCNMLL